MAANAQVRLATSIKAQRRELDRRRHTMAQLDCYHVLTVYQAKLSIPTRFEIVRQIGEGGMGVVYEARDVERNVKVALKTLRYHDPDTLARFKHEFRALQDIH